MSQRPKTLGLGRGENAHWFILLGVKTYGTCTKEGGGVARAEAEIDGADSNITSIRIHNYR